MVEPGWERALPMALRAVQVRAAAAVAAGRVPASDREDFEQEALVGLWLASGRYDPTRATLKTFVERVAERQFASLLRRRNRLRIEPLDGHPFPTPDGIPAIQFRLDFERILSCLTDEDRAVARLLLDHRPTEISRMLGIARSTLYARMARLRRAFLKAGYGPANTGGTR